MTDDKQHAVGVARRLVNALLGWKVTDAVLAPGSRSGPLALAFAAADEQGLIRLHVRVDEREAGFLALGLAKASHRLVPVITTSGTAVANLHPAMLEAKHANVPVLAVTADRPARLRGTGANQTTDQREIFPGIPFIDRVKQLDGGPAHLNLELDEPLIEPIDWDFQPRGRRRLVRTIEGTPLTCSSPVLGRSSSPVMMPSSQLGWPRSSATGPCWPNRARVPATGTR